LIASVLVYFHYMEKSDQEIIYNIYTLSVVKKKKKLTTILK